MALVAAVEALFADQAGSSSGTWLTIRAVLLVGAMNVIMVVAALGYGLIMFAIFDQVFLKPLGLEILPG